MPLLTAAKDFETKESISVVDKTSLPPLVKVLSVRYCKAVDDCPRIAQIAS